MTAKTWLTLPETADLLSLSRVTVWQAVQRHQAGGHGLPAQRRAYPGRPGGLWRVRRVDAEAYRRHVAARFRTKPGPPSGA